MTAKFQVNSLDSSRAMLFPDLPGQDLSNTALNTNDLPNQKQFQANILDYKQ